jgi:hypothetical protein
MEERYPTSARGQAPGRASARRHESPGQPASPSCARCLAYGTLSTLTVTLTTRRATRSRRHRASAPGWPSSKASLPGVVATLRLMEKASRSPEHALEVAVRQIGHSAARATLSLVPAPAPCSPIPAQSSACPPAKPPPTATSGATRASCSETTRTALSDGPSFVRGATEAQTQQAASRTSSCAACSRAAPQQKERDALVLCACPELEQGAGAATVHGAEPCGTLRAPRVAPPRSAAASAPLLEQPASIRAAGLLAVRIRNGAAAVRRRVLP